MSLQDRPYGQGQRLVCNGMACGKKFNPRTPRPSDARELRRRAALHGWTSGPGAMASLTLDFCPDHNATRGDA